MPASDPGAPDIPERLAEGVVGTEENGTIVSMVA